MKKKTKNFLNDEEERHGARHASIAILIIVLAYFAAIVLFSGILGYFW